MTKVLTDRSGVQTDYYKYVLGGLNLFDTNIAFVAIHRAATQAHLEFINTELIRSFFRLKLIK